MPAAEVSGGLRRRVARRAPAGRVRLVSLDVRPDIRLTTRLTNPEIQAAFDEALAAGSSDLPTDTTAEIKASSQAAVPRLSPMTKSSSAAKSLEDKCSTVLMYCV